MPVPTITFNENVVKVRFDTINYDYVSFGQMGYMFGYQGDQMPSREHGDLGKSVKGPAAVAQCGKGLISVNYYPEKDFEFTKGAVVQISGPYGTAISMIEITGGSGQPVAEGQQRFVRLFEEGRATDLMMEAAMKMGFKRGWREAAETLSQVKGVDWTALVGAQKPSS